MQYSSTFSVQYEGIGALIFILILGLVLFFIIGLLILPAVIVAGIAKRRAEKYLNSRQSTVITHFEPPRGLLPAEIGLLYDMQCDKKEILATLFNLEKRGVIKIIDTDKVRVIDNLQYSKLYEYERIAIDFANGEPKHVRAEQISQITENESQDLDIDDFTINLPKINMINTFTKSVQNTLKDKGIKLNNYNRAFNTRVVWLVLILSLLPLIMIGFSGTSYDGVSYEARSKTAVAQAITLTFTINSLFFLVYIITAYIYIFVWTKIAGRYWLNSKQARALWPEIEGYRLYLDKVDLDNIQFESTTPGHDPTTESFPYAMVLGLETKWRDRLKNRQSNNK